MTRDIGKTIKTEEGRTLYTNSVARSKKTQNSDLINGAQDNLFLTLITAVLGVLFYELERRREEYDPYLEDNSEIYTLLNNRNFTSQLRQDFLLDNPDIDHTEYAVIGLATLFIMKIIIDKKLFGVQREANNTKEKISRIKDGEILEALANLEVGPVATLSEIRTQKQSNLKFFKKPISYIAAGSLIWATNLPENSQYLLFSGTRCMVGMMVDIVDKMICEPRQEEVNLLADNLLERFSNDEKTKLAQAIKQEIIRVSGENKKITFINDKCVELVSVMLYFITFHNLPEKTTIYDYVQNLGAASAISNSLKFVLQAALDNKKYQAQIEEIDDIEIGGSADASASSDTDYGPIISDSDNDTEIQDAGIPETDSFVDRVVTRRNSENDMTNIAGANSLKRSYSADDIRDPNIRRMLEGRSCAFALQY